MKKIICVDCKKEFWFDDENFDLDDENNLLNCDMAEVLLRETGIDNEEKATKFIAQAFSQFDKNDLKVFIKPIRCPECKKLLYSKDKDIINSK